MVRDNTYPIKIANSEAGTICSYDLHPDLRYDTGSINLNFIKNQNNDESAVIRITKDNKYDPLKGLIV